MESGAYSQSKGAPFVFVTSHFGSPWIIDEVCRDEMDGNSGKTRVIAIDTILFEGWYFWSILWVSF